MYLTLSSILFALSANVDNLILGFSYGMRGIRISYRTNLLISLIICLATLFSIGAGKQIALFLPPMLASILGSVILISLGLYYMIKSMIHSDSPPQQQEVPPIVTLRKKEAFSLGLALGLNNIGMGIGASISGIPWISTSLASFLFSFLLLYGGNKMGSHLLSGFIKNYAQPFSGLIMIILGIYQFMI